MGQQIDLKGGISDPYNFYSPLLTDLGLDTTILLPDPSLPLRELYFKPVVATLDMNLYLTTNVVSNTDPQQIEVSFMRVDMPSRLEDSIEIYACFTYSQYSNLTDMCDTQTVHTVVNVKGSCFSGLESLTKQE